MAAGSHSIFSEPTDVNVSLWRYMDFTKFVSMLARRGLFFSRLDCLGDPFEGSLPRLNTCDDSYVQPAIAKSVRGFVKELRRWEFASCWYMSEHESAAMWKMYARTEEAICIRSTFAKLKNSLPTEAYVGCVKYIDYEKAIIPMDNLFWPFIHKRLSFEHEREVRAIIQDNKCFSLITKQEHLTPTDKPKPTEGGIWRNINLDGLIEKVYVAPTAPEWFRETVEVTMRKFDLIIPVVRSSLDESPLW